MYTCGKRSAESDPRLDVFEEYVPYVCGIEFARDTCEFNLGNVPSPLELSSFRCDRRCGSISFYIMRQYEVDPQRRSINLHAYLETVAVSGSQCRARRSSRHSKMHAHNYIRLPGFSALPDMLEPRCWIPATTVSSIDCAFS